MCETGIALVVSHSCAITPRLPPKVAAPKDSEVAEDEAHAAAAERKTGMTRVEM